MPGDPHTHHLNHILRPLIDQLVRFWNPGVLLSRTHMFPYGCLVRCAVVPVIADLPALRKAAGFASHSAKRFCSFCTQIIANKADFDVASWGHRTWAEHKQLAEQWLNAPSQAERKKEWTAHQLRWSEFLRLEYWDPTKFAVLDAMHNLLLNNLSRHCRDIWGMDSEHTQGRKGTRPHSPQEQADSIHKCRLAILKSGSSPSGFQSLRKGYMEAFARLNGAELLEGETGTKDNWIDALCRWVCFAYHCVRPVLTIISGQRTGMRWNCAFRNLIRSLSLISLSRGPKTVSSVTKCSRRSGRICQIRFFRPG